MSKRNKTILVGLLLAGLAAASIYLNFFAASRGATAPEEAIKAAQEIAQRQGGGEQPKDDKGVPRDAAPDPAGSPGRFAAQPAGGR